MLLDDIDSIDITLDKGVLLVMRPDFLCDSDRPGVVWIDR